MSEKRFVCIDVDYGDDWYITDNGKRLSEIEIVDLLNEQQATIEQLRTQLLICQQSKNDNGGFQVWEVPPTPKGTRITVSTTFNDKKNDEPFEFNKNCAKPYEIRSVSPNGVVRAGKKNSKVSWRMKDVREISAELPPFEDFNREEYQRIRNKFAPKFGGGDLIGRIIWNIYNGTFEEYI